MTSDVSWWHHENNVLKAAIEDFLVELDKLYAHYLDSTIGFAQVHRMVLDIQSRFRDRISLEQLDANEFAVGFGGDPGEPGHVRQHTTTQGELKRRNDADGENYVQASQNLIVTLFAYWEVKHRAALASSLGIETNQLLVPVMGDLRLLRNDIVHCGGQLQRSSASKLEVIEGLTPDTRIHLRKEQVFALVRAIREAVSALDRS